MGLARHAARIQTLNPKPVVCLRVGCSYSRGLDGTEFVPGTIGLNNLRATDYMNVVIQVRSFVKLSLILRAKDKIGKVSQ